jgi:hypothetical protein
MVAEAGQLAVHPAVPPAEFSPTGRSTQITDLAPAETLIRAG